MANPMKYVVGELHYNNEGTLCSEKNCETNWVWCTKNKYHPKRQAITVCEKCRSKGRCEAYREKLLEGRTHETT